MNAAAIKKPHRPRPVLMIWDGNVMIPLPRFKRLCDAQFAINEEYPLMILEERTQASHNHYFAQVHEAYQNLAEEYAQEFDSEDEMRKWCLVKEGYCTKEQYVLNTSGDAVQMRDALKKQEGYRIVRVNGNVVTVWYPLSQSRPAMKKQMFEDSKAAVLARAASMARTTPAELKKNAGRSA